MKKKVRQAQPLALLLALIVQMNGAAHASNDDLSYCLMLEQNATIQEYVRKTGQLIALVEELNVNDPDRIARALEFDPDDLLYDWIRDRLSRSRSQSVRQLNRLTDTCLYYQRATRFRVVWFSGGSISDNLLKRLVDRVNSLTAVRPKLDSSGNITATQDDLDFSDIKVSNFSYPAREGFFTPVLPHAVWMGGEKAIETVGEQYFPRLEREIGILEDEARSVRAMIERRNRTWRPSDP